ncbi:unnamed protein product [Caenorhabditis bovis]|uniref:Protein kinase domain-containing protein n=1 Tax=Caenorhabditis bovis TaxID=2654633 RepID=A0A8S1EA53_9PELO|nr:unnamed protein product [Caenorhabditis bovis]
MSGEKEEALIFNIGDTVSGYKIVEKIDEGGFGQVFKVSKNDKIYAMKIESNMQEGGSAIKLEIDVLMDLKAKKVPHFPMVYQAGKRPKYHFLVMELLGENLKSLRFKSSNPDCLSPSTWTRIGIQCLYVVKLLHDSGFVHRDIKPSNFAMGLSVDDALKGRMVFLFDFGLARRFVLKQSASARQHNVYRSSNEQHSDEREVKARPRESLREKRSHLDKINRRLTNKMSATAKITQSMRKKQEPSLPSAIEASKCDIECAEAKKSMMVEANSGPVYRFRVARPHTDFRGTQQYASPNAHNQIELGRADDVWSLMYMMAEMTNPLPWTLPENEDTPIEDIKNRTTIQALFKNDVFAKIDDNLKSCNYYMSPDYELIYQTLRGILEKCGASWTDPYDWETDRLTTYVKWKDEKAKQRIVYRWEESTDFFRTDPWENLPKPTKRVKSDEKVKKDEAKKGAPFNPRRFSKEALEETPPERKLGYAKRAMSTTNAAAPNAADEPAMKSIMIPDDMIEQGSKATATKKTLKLAKKKSDRMKISNRDLLIGLPIVLYSIRVGSCLRRCFDFLRDFGSNVVAARFILALLIAIERVLAICFPFQYHVQRKKVPLVAVIPLISIGSAFEDLLYFHICGVEPFLKSCSVFVCTWNFCFTTIYNNYKLTIGALTALVTMILLVRIVLMNHVMLSNDLCRASKLCLVDVLMTLTFDFTPFVLTNFFHQRLVSTAELGPFNSVLKSAICSVDAVVALLMTARTVKTEAQRRQEQKEDDDGLIPCLMSTLGCVSSFAAAVVGFYNVHIVLSHPYFRRKYEYQLFFFRFIADFIMTATSSVYYFNLIVSVHSDVTPIRSTVGYWLGLVVSSSATCRVFTSLLIAAERTLAVYFPAEFHNYRAKLHKFVLPLVALSVSSLDAIVLYVVCAYRFTPNLECIVFTCQTNIHASTATMR